MKERILTNIEPREVLGYFEDLTFIPRESGHEEGVVKYLEEFAAGHGLELIKDDINNVLIRKDAAPGYEDHPGVILQAHLDMVCEALPDADVDFSRDPISFEVDGDKIIARETTLGADDGIGVAFMLALLADKELQHPQLECVFTTDEERGLLGIEAFDFTLLKGDRLINLDSAEEGVAVVGCAGGPVVRVELPVTRKNLKDKKPFFKLSIEGLLGGHSGEDIHRGRANAAKLMSRILNDLDQFQLFELKCGQKFNAIPREAYAIIGIESENAVELAKTVFKYQALFTEEFGENDPAIEVKCQMVDFPETIYDEESKQRILKYLEKSESGIVAMDAKHPELVETSVNLGAVSASGSTAVFRSMVRSSVTAKYQMVHDRISRLADAMGGRHFVEAFCPAWQYDQQSQLRDIYKRVYGSLYGVEPGTLVIHAALEPSKFQSNVDRHLDMISLGPDLRNLHAPGEYVTISSVAKLWETLKALLKAL